MKMTERTMDLIRSKMAADQKAIPALHEQATDLGLAPQPWWNRAFYEYAIQRREAELEAQSKGGDDDDYTTTSLDQTGS